MRTELERYHVLSPEKLDQLIGDLTQRLNGANVHVVVDPHEIYDFCFPVEPGDVKQLDIDKISDDQVALYEMFYLLPEKPVLLSDYVQELETLLNFFQFHYEDVYRQADMVDTMIKESRLDENLDWGADVPTPVFKLVEEKFNIILAVAMGIYSLGVERFTDVTSHRIEYKDFGFGNPRISAIMDRYVESSLASVIFQHLSREIESLQGLSAGERKRRLRAARVDARAIDRVIYLNRSVEQAYLKQMIPQRHIFLYLSDARRNEHIFHTRKVAEALPIIDGRPYEFWRSRRQMLYLVVYKSNAKNSTDSVTQTIQNLQSVKSIFEEFQRAQLSLGHAGFGGCPECILKGRVPHECVWKEVCTKVERLEDLIKSKKLELLRNLGLMSTLSKYGRLLEKKPSDQFREYFNLFRRVHQQGLEKRATEKMQNLQKLISVQAEFTSTLPEGIVYHKDRAYLRSGRDEVTAAIQYLPTRPLLMSESYKGIVSNIVRFYQTPVKAQPREVHLIDIAYKEFIDIETNLTELRGEHELIRCFLYLAFPGVEGDQMASHHAEEMLKKSTVGDLGPFEREFLYVLCWAMRRMKKYDVAEKYCTTSINKYPDDPRFYHGLALDIFSWLSDAQERSKCDYTLADAIDNTKRAITQYRKKFRGDREILSSCYNNLCYFFTERAMEKSAGSAEKKEYLTKAKRALGQLYRLTPSSRWFPWYPEYFHTEAQYQYQECLLLKTFADDRDVLDHKLRKAKHSIDKAIELFPKQKYQILQELITNELYMQKQ